MAGNKTENEKPPLIVIKRIKKVAGGHHGGAWKVAYADFVTAMMAFFLLLWLLNVTTEEQKNAISNYFDPSHPKVSDVTSGAGGILAGMTMSPEGAMVSTTQPIVQPEEPDTTTRGALSPEGKTEADAEKLSEQQLEEELRKKEDERFKIAADKLKAEMANSPDLKDLLANVLIDITPEGLRIQIVDDKGRSMFPSGSAVMYDFMRKILAAVTHAVVPLPNQVSVRGHTDSVRYKEPNRYDNWNLSADRAQASRRVMVENKLPEKRVENVMGRSDREPLVPNEPANPRNRRITIILLRDHITKPARPLPGKATKPTAAEQQKEQAKEEAQEPAKKNKLPGLEIIDDTQPTPKSVAGGSQKNTAGAKTQGEQELPPGYVPLPVMPGGTKTRTEPQSMTYDAPSKEDQQLYEGPTQSPFVNKPPTIRTPVFHLDGEEGAAHTPETTTPAPAHTTPTPAPAETQKKTMTFGEAPVAPHDAAGAAATAVTKDDKTPVKVLQFTPAEKVEDVPELLLIQPKSDALKSLTFGDPEANAPVPTPAPTPAPAPKSSPDKKTLTFE